MAWKAYTKKLYQPEQEEPFKLSRSKIGLFIECPRCFFLDRRLGVSRPSMPAFTLNNTVDHLLKKEFDIHRAQKTIHPLLREHELNLIPFSHPKIDEWRENFVGVQYLDEETNLLVFGAVDDIWTDQKGTIHVVDYKATSKDSAVKELEDTKWHDQYQRQTEVYQWLLRKNDLEVSDTGYFVYVNGKKDNKSFDGKLEFDVNLIPYIGNTDWMPRILPKIKQCLDGTAIPKESRTCEYCMYRTESGEAFKKFVLDNK